MYICDNPTVVVDNVSRFYRADNTRSIFRRPKLSSEREGDYVRALDSVSMVAEKGECIGVLGRNGSGKSTLMRLIAGNEAPDRGNVYVSSSPTLLNVSAALQPRLSGILNIRLGLLAQGVSPNKIPRLSDDIVEFADIGRAVYRPMATYSSGMGARLKFAISTAVRREILLIDEALATGDAGFTRRAQDRMNRFLSDTGTIFLVSHAVPTITSICTRAVWLDEGRVIADGDVKAITKLYSKWMARTARNNHEDAAGLLANVADSYVSPQLMFDSKLEKMMNGGPR